MHGSGPLDELWAALRDGAVVPAPGERARRRATGVFFTPPALAAHVCGVVLGPLLAAARWVRGVPTLRVLDPAAGDGGFLAAALDALAAAATARGARVDARWRARAAAACLVGIERDAALAAAATRRTGARVFVHEALLDAPAEASGVDAVVGNPPYVRSIRLRRADPALWAALRGTLAATSHGEWDLYGAFLERSLGWLRPGGRAGLVVPSRWMTAAFAAPLRRTLAPAVREVIDFGAAQVFADATTYASVVVLERPVAGRNRRDPAAVARLDERRRWATGLVDVAAQGEAPWALAVGDAAEARARLAARGPALGAVARIAKGAGTNADGVFVLEACVVDGAWVRGRDGAGAEVVVERAATVPCLRGRDIAAFGAVDESAPHPRCVFPYDPARGRDALLPRAALARRWPRAAAHLRAHRATLEAREAGRFAGDAYHRFGRPQNLAFHRDMAPKVVVPDVARVGRALVDAAGALVLDTAYAVRPTAAARGDHADAHLLALVLSSPVVTLWLRGAGAPLRGGYLRLKTAYLAPLPLPPPSRALADAAAAARAGALADGLDALRRAYGLDEERWAAG